MYIETRETSSVHDLAKPRDTAILVSNGVTRRCVSLVSSLASQRCPFASGIKVAKNGTSKLRQLEIANTSPFSSATSIRVSQPREPLNGFS
jgi:hypothetical protein